MKPANDGGAHTTLENSPATSRDMYMRDATGRSSYANNYDGLVATQEKETIDSQEERIFRDLQTSLTETPW